MAESNRLSSVDLELNQGTAPMVGATLKEARESVERELINQALRKHSGKIAPAASELGISRPTLYELMEKLGISRHERGGNAVD
jgi:two-component system NtrC family response regulator